MSVPVVSIIMNCYNSDQYLREALESVIAQKYQNWELVFWDNQSTDQSSEIFNSFKDVRFKYFRAENHTNLGKARNLAVSKAKGTWLAFLDCDDVWTANKLEIQLREAESSGNSVGFIYGPVEFKISSASKNKSSMENYYGRLKMTTHKEKSIYEDLLDGNFIIFSTLLIRQDLYLEIGGIDDTLSQNEDYDLVLKASKISNAICVEDICATYRIHDSNNSHKQTELSYLENQKIFHMLPKERLVVRAIKLNASRYAIFKMTNGHFFEGVKMLITEGSPLWVVKRSCIRVVEWIRRGN